MVLKFPEFGNSTKNELIKFVIISHFEVIYITTTTEIVVIDIWNTRQNPQNFAKK
jgi:toxin YoeB